MNHTGRKIILLVIGIAVLLVALSGKADSILGSALKWLTGGAVAPVLAATAGKKKKKNNNGGGGTAAPKMNPVPNAAPTTTPKGTQKTQASKQTKQPKANPFKKWGSHHKNAVKAGGIAGAAAAGTGILGAIGRAIAGGAEAVAPIVP